MKRALVLVALAACSVEKLPPIQMVHRGGGAPAKRVVIMPVDCLALTKVRSTVDPTAWCQGVERIVASELAFRGVEVVDLSRLPARERTRTSVQVSLTADGRDMERQTMTVEGPMFSDVDLWQQRDALGQLGVDGLVQVSLAETATWPVRSLALIRITRPDGSLVAASACDVEVSRMTGSLEIIETTLACALKGLR